MRMRRQSHTSLAGRHSRGLGPCMAQCGRVGRLTQDVLRVHLGRIVEQLRVGVPLLDTKRDAALVVLEGLDPDGAWTAGRFEFRGGFLNRLAPLRRERYGLLLLHDDEVRCCKSCYGCLTRMPIVAVR